MNGPASHPARRQGIRQDAPEDPQRLDDPQGPGLFDDPTEGQDEPPPDAEPGATANCGAGAADEEKLAHWIAGIVRRDESALAALYDATLSRSYGLVLRIVKRAALAEEVVEDTYFQVWRQAPRFDATRGKALTWLLAMARSRAIDALRREARFRSESLDDDTAPEPADAQPPVDELLELAHRHADLHQALLALQAQPRQLVALAFFRGLSHEEIASHTDLPLGTVKSQIRRALMALREHLGKTGLHSLACG